MITSSNGNIVRVTGPLCGEFTGHRWIPIAKASDADLSCFFYLRLNKRLRKQTARWWFETPSCSLWRHCNIYWPYQLTLHQSCQTVPEYPKTSKMYKVYFLKLCFEQFRILFNSPVLLWYSDSQAPLTPSNWSALYRGRGSPFMSWILLSQGQQRELSSGVCTGCNARLKSDLVLISNFNSTNE